MKVKAEFGFTLAEILITIGVIGVVAAMTIPTLMANYQKHQVETRLKGFCSNINNALRLSQEENGDIDGLIEKGKNYTYEDNLEFLQKYIAPYIKLSDYKQLGTSKQVQADLLDGGTIAFSVDESGGDILYFIDGNTNTYSNRQKRIFAFQFAKVNGTVNSDGEMNMTVNSPNFVEPYVFKWDGTRAGLTDPNNKYACAKGKTYMYCTKLIQLNSWKIPADYPW